MWFVMEKIQSSYNVSEQLLNQINKITPNSTNEDYNSIRNILSQQNLQVNRMHGSMMPLHCACIVGSSKVVDMLIDAGADPNLGDGYSRTSLHYAAEKCEKCVTLLLNAGADADSRDSSNNTPLHWACYTNRAASARRLLEKGANVDAMDDSDDSPLSWAALKGHLHIIQLLLNYNANPDTVNISGSSPIGRLVQTIAIGIGSQQEEACLKLLLRACGQINIMQGGQLVLPPAVHNDPDLRSLLLPYLSNPRTLQQLSRTSLRRAFGPGYLPNKVYSLGLPKSLESFVLLT